MVRRSKEEKQFLTHVSLYIGSRWPTDFVPADDVCEATNEFLAMPYVRELFELVKKGYMIVDVNTPEAKAREGCWLRC